MISGANYIGFKTSARGIKSFRAFAPGMNEYLPVEFSIAGEDELKHALALAQSAFKAYSELTYSKRAEFLEAIANEIMELGDTLIERCMAESGLPIGRVTGERGRTCGQLKLFADLLRKGWWVDARIDTAQPERTPLPRPDIRRMLIPIGPVAVFGASNFPLAFSTAGGDTASALAAGCPVIVKSHSSHPGTNALISSAIISAATKTDMPEGVFSSLYLSHEDALKLVTAPEIKAVGFTGSREVGMKLFNAACSRPEPIPVYAEMSAINPVIILEGALNAKKDAIAANLAASVTLGAGQFCTNPGLVLMVESKASENFLETFAQQLRATLPATMLNKNIYKAYTNKIKELENKTELTVLAQSTTKPVEECQQAAPVAYTIPAHEFISKKEFSAEVFGPATLFVLCKNTSQLFEAIQAVEGQLTATVHADVDDEGLNTVINIVTQKAGRIIYGGYPTGVEVCHAMQHGGPFPSTTHAGTTSVGTAAIYRFVRPVALQDFPDELLPEPLKNSNPLSVLRLVNGQWTDAAIN